jgi:aspartate racemase
MSDAVQEKTVGVMGGLGPHATLDFFAKLLSATKASTDQDHLHVIIENNPKVPNRHAAIEGTGPDAAPYLVQMAVNLEQAGADFVVMACNTAHAFQKDIETALTVPFISIIDEVAAELSESYSGISSIGLMAAEGCLAAQLYQRALKKNGLTPVIWADREMTRFMSIIYRIKADQRSADIHEDLIDLANVLTQRGAEVIVAGCTEVPLILSPADVEVPLISSTDLLVQRTVAYAKGDIALPGTGTN